MHTFRTVIHRSELSQTTLTRPRDPLQFRPFPRYHCVTKIKDGQREVVIPVAGGLDPLKVRSEFWQRAEVCTALSQRDIGHLFRLLRQYCGASQTQIGAAVGYSQSTVSPIMIGIQRVSAMAVLERIADGLDMPDDARLRLGLAPKEIIDFMKRRTALGIGLIGTLTPATLTAVLRESAIEALEFTRECSASAVGQGTLEHLAAVIADLEHAYPWRPATELFPVARIYRQRVDSFIKGKRTLKEARELYVRAAHLSGILSDLAHDLGSRSTAEAYAIDSYRHANQAGHDELCAWASRAVSTLSVFAGQPDKAIAAAERGISKAPGHSPIAARLHASAARGYALQGNGARCNAMLIEARNLSDQLPNESPSRIWVENSALTSCKILYYAAYSHILVADYRAAEREAREALAAEAWSPGTADMARIELGIALAHLGRPDEAAEHGKQTLAQPRFVGYLLPRALELDTVLKHRYPTEPLPQEFHEHYRQLVERAAIN